HVLADQVEADRYGDVNPAQPRPAEHQDEAELPGEGEGRQDRAEQGLRGQPVADGLAAQDQVVLEAGPIRPHWAGEDELGIAGEEVDQGDLRAYEVDWPARPPVTQT